METVELPSALVYAHADGRPLDENKILALTESVREIGLLSPIIVRRAQRIRNGQKADAYEILAGHHRYEACAVRLKWEHIPCVIKDTTDLLAELVMIDENLCRAELTPAQAAFQTARRKEVYEALHPETKALVFKGNQHTGEVTAKFAATSFAAQTARTTGRAERTVRLDAARGEALGPSIKRIVNTSLDKGIELDALAKLPTEERENLMARAERGERVSAQSKSVKKTPAPLSDAETEEQWLAAIMRIWNRGSQEWRERFLTAVDQPVMDRRRDHAPGR